MNARVELLGAEDVDFGLYASLQRRSFRAHLDRYDVDTGFMNERYFRWKYLPPAGAGHVAVIPGDRGYHAGAAVTPLRAGNGSAETLIWRLQDIATDPERRGKGFYSALLQRLKAMLGENEVLAAYPNRNSTRGFTKAGAEAVCYVPTWVSPVLPFSRRHPAVEPLRDLAELDGAEWFGLFTAGQTTSLVRNAAYFDWRYRRNPEFEYQVFVGRDGDQRGLIVFRGAELYGRRIVYVLETWAGTSRMRARLMAAPLEYGRRHKAFALVTVTNGLGTFRGLAQRWVAVPRRFVPKEQILRVICSDDRARDVVFNAWRVEMGDLPEF